MFNFVFQRQKLRIVWVTRLYFKDTIPDKKIEMKKYDS